VVVALLAHGRVRRGFLGVSGYPVRLPPALAGELGQRAGLILIAVQPDGPAEKAGLYQGDVLVSLAGHPIAHVGDLQAELDEDRIGQALPVRALRAGKVFDTSISVAARA
jgi:S1-C subfamily serine protease